MDDGLHPYLHEFDQLVADLLPRFDEFDPDELEAEKAEGVLRLTFADGSRCILNRQSAVQQVWLAEGASAWHFTLAAGERKWLDTKGRGDLRTILAGILTRKLGRQVDLGS